MKSAILYVLLSLPFLAHADDWTGRDKTLHFIGGAAVGAAVTLATDKPMYGIAAGAAVGLAKELYDTQHRATHTPSAKDLVMTIVGAAVGSYATHLLIRKDFIGYRLNF
ncbi:lipoprotein [uncultured Caudovirales phage]|uniref:Lipoprotein n=1 Tax=uncultured Caudovirales phage TaxID=2100421 RepID=A0A6J5S3S4_9CAUD|nr:lipoprotein [uncultured Caudovirales phage]